MRVRVRLFGTLKRYVSDYDPEHVDGESLMPLLKESGRLKRDAIFFHYPHYHHQGYMPGGAVREGDYKLIEWYEEAKLGLDNSVELYNVREDVGEENDLAAKMPEKAKALLEKLHQWRRDVGAAEMTVNPNFDPTKVNVRQ